MQSHDGFQNQHTRLLIQAFDARPNYFLQLTASSLERQYIISRITEHAGISRIDG